MQQPRGQVPDVDHLCHRMRGVGDEHWSAAVTRGAGDPVAGPSGVVTWPADKAGSGHEQPVADGVAGRLLAGDLGFAVLFAVYLVAIGRREHLYGFVGS